LFIVRRRPLCETHNLNFAFEGLVDYAFIHTDSSNISSIHYSSSIPSIHHPSPSVVRPHTLAFEGSVDRVAAPCGLVSLFIGRTLLLAIAYASSLFF
jgi:hypothetical protein